MIIQTDSNKRFKEQAKLLKTFYPAYAENIERSLWYAECIYGMHLDEFLKTPVCIEDGYWKPSRNHLQYIQKNVFSHLHKAKTDSKEKLRLIDRGPADIDLRNTDPDFFNEVVHRYGDDVLKYKIDQTVSVVGIDKDAFHIQKSCYIDQLGSNILCDEPATLDDLTMRELNTDSGALVPFEYCSLANTIGVAAMFIDRHGVPLLRWRKQQDAKRRIAIMEEGWHCTSSGVLTWEDFVETGKCTNSISIESVVRGIQRESELEAGIYRDIDLYEVSLLAFARELKRAGKPQFFFLIKFPNHTATELVELIMGRHLLEGDEYGQRDFRALIPQALRPKSSVSASDFLIDPELNINRLTTDKLFMRSNAENAIRFTFEAYANLFFAARDRR